MIRKILVIAAIATMLVTTGCSKKSSSTTTPPPPPAPTFPDGYWLFDRSTSDVDLSARVATILHVTNGGSNITGIVQFPTCDVTLSGTVASNGKTGGDLAVSQEFVSFSGTYNELTNVKTDYAGNTEYDYYSYLGDKRTDFLVDAYLDTNNPACGTIITSPFPEGYWGMDDASAQLVRSSTDDDLFVFGVLNITQAGANVNAHAWFDLNGDTFADCKTFVQYNILPDGTVPNAPPLTALYLSSRVGGTELGAEFHWSNGLAPYTLNYVLFANANDSTALSTFVDTPCI